MNQFALIIPPHYAMEYKGEGFRYFQWVDPEDHDHITGQLPGGKIGALVGKPGYRLRIKKGEVEIYEKRGFKK